MMHIDKAQQRRQAYDARNAQRDKDAVSREIVDKFLVHAAYRQAKTVMFYLHCRSEVRTRDRVREQLSGDKHVVVPYCTKDADGQNRLGLWKLEDLQELQPGMWGILEPPKVRWGESGKEIAPEALDLVMVPGVAFDRRGGRLGNGAGYYDRLLKSVGKDTVLIGMCFEAQIMPEIVMEAHDIYMDYVITETAIYKGRGRF